MGLTRTRFSQSNTAIAKIQDPITVLNNESTIANVDVGFLINRNHGAKSNVAIFWSETGSEFATAITSANGIPDSNISVSSYANIRVGSLFGNVGGGSDQANVYITGSIIPSSNVAYDLGSSTNRFRSLWVSGNTIYVGRESISVDGAGMWSFTSGNTTINLGEAATFNNPTIITGNLTVTSNLTVQGTQFIANTVDVSFVDSAIELHTLPNLAPLTSDDGRDIGIKLHYYKTQDEHAFLGWVNDTGYLEWYDSGRETVGNVFTGNTYGTIKSGGLILANTTTSVSTTTGALQVAGGVGIAGNLYVNNVGDVSANIGTVKISIDTVNANIGSYQLYANANAASQQTTIDTLVSNAAAQQTTIGTIDANIGSYQIYANANAALQSADITSIITTANANTAAYLQTYTGNIAAGNLIASGNVYGSIVPTTIFKDFFIGTTAVPLSRGSASLTVDNLNTTGYAAQANLAVLATNATKTTVTSNISSGTAYISFVSATTGNVDQNVNTGLTYDPNSGNLRTYAAFVDTDLTVGGNLTVQNISFTNQEIITTTEITQGNLVANSGVESVSNVTGALVVRGGIGASGNVFANVFYTTNGIRWAGNGAVFASGGGGGGAGLTYTAATTPPTTGNISGDQWYNTSADILYEYVNDGTTSYWIDVQSLGQTGNITTISDATLQGNIIVGLSNVYSIGSSTGLLNNLFASNITVARNITTGNLTSNANIIAGNLTTTSNIVTNRLTTTTGVFWANGSSFGSGGTNTATVNALIWAQKIFWG